jgi:hypothetical protein
MSDQPTTADIDLILADPDAAAYQNLRDRSAYVYLTGSYPSHLRTLTTRRLTLMMSKTPLPDGTPAPPGGLHLLPEYADRLGLEAHPMVRKVREHQEDGYRIRLSLGPNERKPYGKVLVFKDEVQRTINIDGSVKDGWG